MIKVGITGSIASGKTTVARMFAGKKYPLFDADNEVRRIYKKNVFKEKIRKKFGLKNKKNIKGKIQKVIFKNKKNLQKLEKIIHPLVRKELKNFIKKNKKKKVLIFEIPLLIESRLMRNFNKIIFVNSNRKIRLRRFLKRGKNKKIFDFLDKRQLTPVKKIKFSDYVINNNNSLEFLKKNVKIIKNNL
tara:strand:- start:1542 stop:2105 length:564 start_codon:yes stop_codon:yes gene_type:complete